MPPRLLEGAPGPRPRTVRTADGTIHEVPEGWELLPPGDALVTRRVKAAGACWSVSEKVGRREMSRGIWAPAVAIQKVTAAVQAERQSPDHARRLEAGRARRAREQDAYVVAFERHVLAFLGFAPVHAELAAQLARRVAEHATPVGSGTVARTERIPVAERAEAAVIAWLRHQTTAYDHMTIQREKGARREVRRALAKRSRELLDRYRRGEPIAAGCPLARALAEAPRTAVTETQTTSSNDRPTARPQPLPSARPSAPAARPSGFRPRPAVAAPKVEADTTADIIRAASIPVAPEVIASPRMATAPAAPVISADDDAEMERRRARQAAMRARLAKR
jgi:hypothetical protein